MSINLPMMLLENWMKYQDIWRVRHEAALRRLAISHHGNQPGNYGNQPRYQGDGEKQLKINEFALRRTGVSNQGNQPRYHGNQLRNYGNHPGYQADMEKQEISTR